MRDGTWINSFTCHCVEYHHDDEMKVFLKAVCALTRPHRASHDAPDASTLAQRPRE
jgi:hypothetical protein